MADRKTTDNTALTASNAVDTDVYMIVDVSDTTDAPSGTNKKMTVDETARLYNQAGADLFLYYNFY